MWDADKGTEILTLKGHTSVVNSVSWSPDGKRILTESGGFDNQGRLSPGEAKVWDAKTGTEILTLAGHRDRFTSVAFSSDGKRLFAWDAKDKVQAWSTTDGQPADLTNPHTWPGPGAARSPDGRLFAKPNGTHVAIVDLLQPAPSDSAWPFPDAAERNRYHTEQVALAEKEQNWFAAAFHLGRLLLDDPDNSDLKKRREAALQKHAGP